MTGYVKRINESTFNVPIGGIRIGTAKYSLLAQINLNSRIITFSRYAIENVPERGRRYLVLHELAHVKEASHNQRFWRLVEQFEPDYRQIGKNLEKAFKENVKGKQSPGPSILTLDNSRQAPLSSESSVGQGLLLTGTAIDFEEEELLSFMAEEKEKFLSDPSIQSIYDCEMDHFLDWEIG